jgi:hypothetical protein
LTLTYLEADVDKVATFERGVRTGHGDDLGFFHQQIVGTISTTPQQLKGTELLTADYHK